MNKTIKIIIIAIIIIMLAAGFFAFLSGRSLRKWPMTRQQPADFPTRETAPEEPLSEVPALAEQSLDLPVKQIRPILSPN